MSGGGPRSSRERRPRAAVRARLALPLVTSRLELREFVRADLASLGAVADDRRVRQFAPAESRALDAARRAATGPRSAPRRAYELAVIVRRSGKLIGACDLALAGRRAADIGFMLAPRHWGFGYGTEVAAALVGFGFEQLALEHLSAVVAIENERSRHVLENAGLVWEGLMPRALRIGGRCWDCHRYTIDRPRWLAGQAPCATPAARGS